MLCTFIVLINKIINRYGLLPAFLQEIVIEKILKEAKKDVKNAYRNDNNELNDYIRNESDERLEEIIGNLYKASKTKIRFEKIGKFTSDAVSKSGFSYKYLFDKLTFEENRELFGKFRLEEKIEYFTAASDVNVQKEVFADILQEISALDEEERINHLESLYRKIESGEFKLGPETLKEETETLYHLYKGFSHEIYNRNRKNIEYPLVITRAMSTIFTNLPENKKEEILPIMIGEMKKTREIHDSSKYGYRRGSFYDDIISNLPEIVQGRHFNELMQLAESGSECLDYFNSFTTQIQIENFNRFIQHIQNIHQTKMTDIWKELNEDVQRTYYVKVLMDRREELYERFEKRYDYEYRDLYSGTNSKLQSEILNHEMFHSLNADSTIPTGLFRELLKESKETVFDKNFQYFFAHLKGRYRYASDFLNAVPDNIKEKYSSTIGKYLSVNTEDLIKTNFHNMIIKSASYLDSDSLKILFDNLVDFSEKNPNLTDENGKQIITDKVFISFFTNMKKDLQEEILDETLENPDKTYLFQKMFNSKENQTFDENETWIRKYLENFGYNEEIINKKINKFKLIYEKNNLVGATINLDFIKDSMFDNYDIGKLLLITHYPMLQDTFIKYGNNKKVIDLMNTLMNSSENWTITADKVIQNLQQDKNILQILQEIENTNLTEQELSNFTRIISKPNIFELSTYDDIREYDSPNGKRMQIINKILSGNYNIEDLPEYFRSLPDIERKRIVISEIMIDDINFSHMTKNYKDGINLLDRTKLDPQLFESFDQIQEYMKICSVIQDADQDTINKISERILDGNTPKRVRVQDIESKIINLFGSVLEAELYNPNKFDDKSATEIYINPDTNEETTIQVHRIEDDFTALVRVEGAYANYIPPDNYKEYFDSPLIDYHGNCEGLIGNDMISPAREKENSLMVGYSEVQKNSLLLCAPYDLSSDTANHTLAPVNNQSNCRFLPPNKIKDETRHTHSEVVKERLLIDSDGNVEKLQPSYIVWMEEEEGEPFPPIEKDKIKRFEVAKKAAAQMGLPIVVINREHFAKREKEKIEVLTKMIKGEVEIPEDKTIKDIMVENITKLENNSNSLRFNEKLGNKYFNSKNREEINELIFKKIEEIAKTNPEFAYECLSAVREKYQFEISNVEENKYDSKNVKEVYGNLEIRAEELQEHIGEFLDKEDTLQYSMEEQASNKFNEAVKEVSQTHFYDGQKQHSIEHIEKVMFFSQILAQNEGLDERDTSVLLAAAALHDSSRNGEEGNVEHAAEGAITAGEFLRQKNGFDISEQDIPIVQAAIEYHEHKEKPIGSLDIEYLVKLCQKYNVKQEDIGRTTKCAELLKDADALDRTRFAKKGGLSPNFLRSKTAKNPRIVSMARKLNDRYAEKMLEMNYHVHVPAGKRVQELRNQRIRAQDRQEQQLSANEMLEMFNGFTQKRGTIQTDEKKIDILFQNYGESQTTIKEIQQAEEMIREDLVSTHDIGIKQNEVNSHSSPNGGR